MGLKMFAQVMVVRRDNFAKSSLPLENIVVDIKGLLEDVQQSLFDKAKVVRDSCIVKVSSWDDFMGALNDKKMVLAPWCDEVVGFIVALFSESQLLGRHELMSFASLLYDTLVGGLK